MERPRVPSNAKNQNDDVQVQDEALLTPLIPLFRILIQAPPNGHDCKACPICKKYGIMQID
jgi:hypothetical protein